MPGGPDPSGVAVAAEQAASSRNASVISAHTWQGDNQRRHGPGLGPVLRGGCHLGRRIPKRSASGRVWVLSRYVGVAGVSHMPGMARPSPAFPLLAALAEHLAAQHDQAAPEWTEIRVLQRPWFPAELEAQRADALIWAPAAFRKHGVYLSARGPGGRVTGCRRSLAVGPVGVILAAFGAVTRTPSRLAQG